MGYVASQPFPLNELARNQATTFKHQSVRLSILRPFVNFVLFPVASHVAERVALHYAQRFAQQAIWFQGAALAVESESFERQLDPLDALRTQLDAMEGDLPEIAAGARAAVLHLRKLDGKERGRVRDALERLASAAEALRDEVRMFKGSVQAHDANVGVIGRARRIHTTSQELEAELDRCVG